MSSAASHGQRGAGLPLLALAIGAFGIGTTEFAPMGMLPNIAEGVGVTIPTAGLLVSAYAAGVMVGAPFMTLFLARWPRRRALMVLMSLFVIGNVLSAIAPNYLSLVGARLVTSLNHGAFFGLGSLVAASLVPREKQASAVATMFMGLTLANVGGVPAATWLSQTIGWRESFAAISALGLIAIASLGFALPAGAKGDAPDVRSELRELVRPPVLLGIAATILGAGAMFTMYTYVNPLLTALTHASPAFITSMLVLVGVGFTIGNSVGGKLADWSVEGALVIVLLSLAAIMFAFPWLATTTWGAGVALTVWGAASFAIVPPMQTWVMRAAAGAPGLASSVNIGAFNMGNALGAALGGAVLGAGMSYTVLPIAGAALALVSLLLVLGNGYLARKTAVEAQACA
ncbi:MFS transporter [Luteibacter aegosomaticola]|uniref:MFS transporter n=1 Tax=Luteibacter aegosomaticola TaxID=2911538 RepID=UPI001FF7E0DE|nr:MFS transporter [Luteibacter aegosomaticola]UPG89992.1 MFS transporter [Luteibacter aegosomaticola]